MVDLKHFAELLAGATMLEEDREGWAHIIPHLTEKELEDLYQALSKEDEAFEQLRVSYLAKAKQIIENGNEK